MSNREGSTFDAQRTPSLLLSGTCGKPRRQSHSLSLPQEPSSPTLQTGSSTVLEIRMPLLCQYFANCYEGLNVSAGSERYQRNLQCACRFVSCFRYCCWQPSGNLLPGSLLWAFVGRRFTAAPWAFGFLGAQGEVGASSSLSRPFSILVY